MNFMQRICLLVTFLVVLSGPNNDSPFFGIRTAAVSAESVVDTLDLNDPELQEAMEIFAGMSPDEMEDTMKMLAEMVGDNPEALAAVQEIMTELPKMKKSDVQSSLKDMIADDEVAAATQDALKLLKQSDWETIWGKQDLILDAVIKSGQISAEDAALYKTDNAAWEKELRFIWDELEKQAAAAAKAGDEL